MSRAVITLALLVTLLAARGARAQEIVRSEAAETAFQQALEAFSGGDYERAAREFHALALLTPAHQRVTSAMVMEAQARYRLGQWEETETAAQGLLTRYPGSAYVPNARYLVGLARLGRREYAEGASWIARSLPAAGDSALARDARALLTSIVDERLSAAQVRALSEQTPEAGWLRAKLVEKLLKEGDRAGAQAEFDRVRTRPDAEVTSGWLASMQAQLSRRAAIKIGVLLPDGEAGSAKATAAEVLDGIRFALERHTHPAGAEITLELRSSTGDTAGAAGAARSLAADGGVIAVLGPMFSSVALTVAPVLNEARVPMLSPTAQADGLAAIGPYVVQLNPDQSVRGAAMARYAVEQLGYLRLAVLTASDPRARVRAESFRSAALRAGAQVLAFETFEKDSSDLRQQFMKIRQAGAASEPALSFAGKMTAAEVRRLVRAGADATLIREARRRNETVPLSRLFGPRGREIADSLGLSVITPEVHADDIDMPITTLDALYISLASGDEIDVVAPQLSYFNIRTQLLGSEEWNDPAQLAANRRYTDNMLVAVDAFADETDSAYGAFASGFRKWKGAPPGRMTLYGYDAMNALLGLIASGGTTRELLARRMGELDDEEALHAPLRVRNRVNTSMQILKIERGSPKLIRTQTSE